MTDPHAIDPGPVLAPLAATPAHAWPSDMLRHAHDYQGPPLAWYTGATCSPTELQNLNGVFLSFADYEAARRALAREKADNPVDPG